MKMKVLLILGVIGVYLMATYCILNRQICKFYKDYYLLNNRSISWDDEIEFTNRKISKIIDMFVPHVFHKNHEAVQLIGFSYIEEEGRWTVGNIAKLAFQLPEVLYYDVSVAFTIKPYINKHHEKVSAKVYVNGVYETEWVFEKSQKTPETVINISQQYAKETPRIEVAFIIDGMVSPKSLGYGEDTRKLGLFFKDITVSPNMDNIRNSAFSNKPRKKKGGSVNVTK